MEVQYLPTETLHGKSIFLAGPEAHHVLRVRRHRAGDTLLFADGRGRFIRARIDRISPKDLHAEVMEIEDDPRERGAPWLQLGLALLKGEHFDLAVEKCTELGVHRIIPLLTERCVLKWKPDAGAKRLARWERIAQSAMKQSGRSWLPIIDEPVELYDLPARVDAASRWVLADEEEDQDGLAKLDRMPDQPVLGLVGPEGSFSPQEKDWIDERGAIALSLGRYRLRSETAAVALCARLAMTAGAGEVSPPDSSA